MTRPGSVVTAVTPHTIQSTRHADPGGTDDLSPAAVDDRFPGVQWPAAAGGPLAAVPGGRPHPGRHRARTAGSAAAEVDSVHPP